MNARSLAFGLVLLAPVALGAAAQEVHPAETLPVPDPPHQRAGIVYGYGIVHFPITCTDDQTQRFFDQGVAMLHGFDLRGADRAFHDATMREPGCAMAYWGRAMANADHPDRVRTFVRRAVDRRANATPREQQWIDALAACLTEPPARRIDGVKLADAFARFLEDDPSDVEARAFYIRQIALNRIAGVTAPPPVALAPVLARLTLDHPASGCGALLEADAERALARIEAVVRSAPKNGYLLTLAARLQSNAGRSHDALMSVREAVRLFESDPLCPPLPTTGPAGDIDDTLCIALAHMPVADAIDHVRRRAWRPFEAPALTLPDKNGTLHRLQEYRGKPVLLVFFLGAGCPHCFEQMHELAPQRERFAEAGISVITISTDSLEGLQQTFEVRGVEEAMPYLTLCDADLDRFRAYGVFDEFSERPLHGMFLLDAQGRVRWRHIGLEPFFAIRSLLDAAEKPLTVPTPSP